ncbi:MAG: integrase core domain-containing protein [Gemmatimonadota bacterium]
MHILISEKHGTRLRAPSRDVGAAIGMRVARPREGEDFLLQGVCHRLQAQRDQRLDHGDRQAVRLDGRRRRAGGGGRRNGPPFVTRALCGLSHLNVWWMRLGIQHQRIRPASPQENGAHERMHRTLKREAIRPPRASMRAQQRAFDAFRAEYNEERPHAHHGGQPPGSQYEASPREYPSRLPALEYPGHYVVKRVTTVGTFRFKTTLLFIANALRGYCIGLDEEADGIWSIYFGDILLAKLDERDMIIRE